MNLKEPAASCPYLDGTISEIEAGEQIDWLIFMAQFLEPLVKEAYNEGRDGGYGHDDVDRSWERSKSNKALERISNFFL